MKDLPLKRMMSLIYTVLLIYLLVVIALYFGQRRILYLPESGMQAPSEYGFPLGHAITMKSSDGLTLQAWYHAAKEHRPTILYFHGNAAHLGFRAPKFQAFAEKGFGVLAVSYRGYGDSQGRPSEQGIYHDARAAVHYAKETLKLSPEQTVFYGESLGSGVAVQMATETSPRALILEAPYTSVATRASEIYWFIPIHYIIQDKFDSLSKITRVTCPLLILHGEQDTVIPVAHGRALLDTATTGRKRGIFLPEIAHTNFDPSMLAASVEDFIRE